jgi:hypothetical protein
MDIGIFGGLYCFLSFFFAQKEIPDWHDARKAHRGTKPHRFSLPFPLFLPQKIRSQGVFFFNIQQGKNVWMDEMKRDEMKKCCFVL